MSILSEILISGNYTYTENSENAKVNHMVAWHSAKVITHQQAESALLGEECRVAPFAPITRAYISHGWNCKHGRNCQYACQGMIKGEPSILDSGYEIRGPCEREETDYQQMEEST